MFNSSNLFSVSYKRTAGSEAFVFHASSKWVTAKPPCQDWVPLLLLSFAGCEIIAIRHRGHFNMVLVSLIFPHHLCYCKCLHGNQQDVTMHETQPWGPDPCFWLAKGRYTVSSPKLDRRRRICMIITVQVQGLTSPCQKNRGMLSQRFIGFFPPTCCAIKLPDPQSNSYAWDSINYFFLPPKLQTHRATIVKPPLSQNSIHCLSPISSLLQCWQCMG